MKLYKIIAESRGSKRYGPGFLNEVPLYVVAPNMQKARQKVEKFLSSLFDGRVDITEIKKVADEDPGSAEERVTDQLLLAGL